MAFGLQRYPDLLAYQPRARDGDANLYGAGIWGKKPEVETFGCAHHIRWRVEENTFFSE